MSILNDETGRGYTCHFRDGTKKFGLSYIESLALFREFRDTDNPCSVTAPGYGEDCDPKNDRRVKK